jgi:hypothetical protein
MASQQKITQAREQVENFRLRAAIRAGAPTGGDEIFRSNDSGAGDQKLWDALRAGEAVEIENQRKSKPHFANLATMWSKPLAEILKMKSYAMPLLLDVDAGLPLKPADKIDYSKVESTVNDFLSLMQAKNQALSTTGQNRLVTYVSVQTEGSHVIAGVSYDVDVTDINTWIRALNRLVDFGAFGDEYAALLEDAPQSEPVEESSAADLKTAAEEEWSQFPLFHAWEQSLESGFGIKLNDSYRRIVCDEFVRANLSPYAADSYNKIRQILVARERFPARPDGEPALTLDERMALATENYILSDPIQKKAWCHEMGRLRAILGE